MSHSYRRCRSGLCFTRTVSYGLCAFSIYCSIRNLLELRSSNAHATRANFHDNDVYIYRFPAVLPPFGLRSSILDKAAALQCARSKKEHGAVFCWRGGLRQ